MRLMARYQLDADELRARLTTRQKDLQMSWRSFSAEVGISYQAMHRFMHGQCNPSADLLLTLLRYLGLSASYVTKRNEEHDD